MRGNVCACLRLESTNATLLIYVIFLPSFISCTGVCVIKVVVVCTCKRSNLQERCNTQIHIGLLVTSIYLDCDWEIQSIRWYNIQSNLCLTTPANSGFLSTKASLIVSRENRISSFLTLRTKATCQQRPLLLFSVADRCRQV